MTKHKLTPQQRATATRRRTNINACGRCDENGWLIINNKAHRCTHPDHPDQHKHQP